MRAIRRNLLYECDTGSLRNLGVTGDEEEDDDDDDHQNGKSSFTRIKQMHHLFRPHRDDPGCAPTSDCCAALTADVVTQAVFPRRSCVGCVHDDAALQRRRTSPRCSTMPQHISGRPQQTVVHVLRVVASQEV